MKYNGPDVKMEAVLHSLLLFNSINKKLSTKSRGNYPIISCNRISVKNIPHMKRGQNCSFLFLSHTAYPQTAL